jgi:hypothetical protein
LAAHGNRAAARDVERKRYIQSSTIGVLSLVPRRSKFIAPLDELYGRIGSRAFERTRTVVDGSSRSAISRHIGWRWPCDCLAFARPEGDYLWVPCKRHDELRAASRT